MGRAYRALPNSEFGILYQFSRLKIISKPYQLAYPSLKSPPPLQRGAGGISGESFQKVKVSFFKELKCYDFYFFLALAVPLVPMQFCKPYSN
jgi:hypothetical protein